MHDQAATFTELRPVLIMLAQRMLGSQAEAEDMVQEAYVRWQRADLRTVRSPRAFLTTMVTRLCLNHLNLARVRLEHADAPLLLEDLTTEGRNPAEHAELADALSDAFTRLLGRLSATERVVFLLREAFDFEYAQIALVVDRTEANCRQILRRARERLVALEPIGQPAPQQFQRVVSEFLKAAETGDMEGLLSVLCDDAALCQDPGDLTKPIPPAIYDPQRILARVEEATRNMHLTSDHFVCGSFGRDYLWIAPSARILNGAIVLRLKETRVASVQLVGCPALLRQFQMLMSMAAHKDFREGLANPDN